MITEARSIVLSDNELITALRPLIGEGAIADDIAVENIQLNQDIEGNVDAAITFEGDEEMSFNHNQLRAAILHHCMAQRIPIPRGVEKELTMRGDQIAMVIRMTMGEGS